MKISSRTTIAPDIVTYERDKIVATLQARLAVDELVGIASLPRDELRGLCSELYGNFGRYIRNEFKLWEPEHPVTNIWQTEGPKLGTMGCDEHPCHPDNFSFSIIEALWEKLQ